MAWYDSTVFYHIYPLGLCGCGKENTGVQEHHFDKLKAWAEHAQELNFTAIYIGPLFESVGHGYETTDYKKVDCRLGSNEDFKDFVSYCHDIGIRVIVDGVFNHVGRRFFAFEDVKEKREHSPYCGWFCNLNFWGNNEYNDGFSYDNWGGYNLLVKLNQRNPEVQNYIFDVIRFWVSEFDIDGIRLDAADVLDFDFMKAMRGVANEVKPDFWLMGEVIHGDYSRWVNDETLHSVTNYELHKGLYSGHNDHNYFEIAHSIKRLNDICRGRKLYTFLDNHDVERIASKLNNKAHLPLVTMLLYTIYGIPSVYYGSEFGLEGKKERGSDWNLRPSLDLSDYEDALQENVLTKLCKQLGFLKKKYSELTDGRYQELLLTNRQFALGRILSDSACVTALNCDDDDAVLEFNVPVSPSHAVDLLGGAREVEYQNGHLRVSLGANSGTVILLTNDASKKPLAQDAEYHLAAAESVNVFGDDSVGKEETEACGDVEPAQEEADQKTYSIKHEGVGIVVKDVKPMADFYRDVLGFDAAYEENMACARLERDGMVLMLYGRSSFEEMTSQKFQYPEGLNGCHQISVGVEDYAAVDAAYERTIKAGARPILAPVTREWGKRVCYIADPEGNLIEIGAFQ